MIVVAAGWGVTCRNISDFSCTGHDEHGPNPPRNKDITIAAVGNIHTHKAFFIIIILGISRYWVCNE